MNIEKIEVNPRQYVWVDKDAEIKEGDFVLSKLFVIVKFGKKYTKSLYKKIIEASPELNLKLK